MTAPDTRSPDEPRIAAVIPAYDRERTIARAIESILAQTWPAAEIIVVDDGSRDDTRRVVERFGERVRCVTQANAGASAARNRGVREAKQPWVAFLDSDDHWRPQHLERIARAIRATDGRAALYFADLLLSPDHYLHTIVPVSCAVLVLGLGCWLSSRQAAESEIVDLLDAKVAGKNTEK